MESDEPAFVVFDTATISVKLFRGKAKVLEFSDGLSFPTNPPTNSPEDEERMINAVIPLIRNLFRTARNFNEDQMAEMDVE